MRQDGEAAKGKTAWSCGLLWFPECNPLPCHYLGARRPLPLPDTEVATWTHGIDDRDKCHFKDERKAHLWICTIHFEGWCMICSYTAPTSSKMHVSYVTVIILLYRPHVTTLSPITADSRRTRKDTGVLVISGNTSHHGIIELKLLITDNITVYWMYLFQFFVYFVFL